MRSGLHLLASMLAQQACQVSGESCSFLRKEVSGLKKSTQKQFIEADKRGTVTQVEDFLIRDTDHTTPARDTGHFSKQFRPIPRAHKTDAQAQIDQIEVAGRKFEIH